MGVNRLTEGARWLEQAGEDLTSAEVLLDARRFYLVCFLAQQIAEKALKAFLYATGDTIVLGHSVEELGRRAMSRDSTLEDSITKCGVLDAYYVPTRYPDALPDTIPARVFREEAAGQALELAREVVRAVRARWPSGEGLND